MAEPEALSLIEFTSIARGTRAVDALVKKAPIQIERVGTLQPGTMAVLFSGDVASVEASYAEALRVAEDRTSDELLLPQIDPSVYRATLGYPTIGAEESGWQATPSASSRAAPSPARCMPPTWR